MVAAPGVWHADLAERVVDDRGSLGRLRFRELACKPELGVQLIVVQAQGFAFERAHDGLLRSLLGECIVELEAMRLDRAAQRPRERFRLAELFG